MLKIAQNKIKLIDLKEKIVSLPTNSRPLMEGTGRALTKCGVSISSEKRNISHWRITDEKGNIIFVQKFV